jgi:hypothetical protein
MPGDPALFTSPLKFAVDRWGAFRPAAAACGVGFCLGTPHGLFKVVVGDLQVMRPRDVLAIPDPSAHDAARKAFSERSLMTCPQVVKKLRPWSETRGLDEPLELCSKMAMAVSAPADHVRLSRLRRRIASILRLHRQVPSGVGRSLDTRAQSEQTAGGAGRATVGPSSVPPPSCERAIFGYASPLIGGKHTTHSATGGVPPDAHCSLRTNQGNAPCTSHPPPLSPPRSSSSRPRPSRAPLSTPKPPPSRGPSQCRTRLAQRGPVR